MHLPEFDACPMHSGLGHWTHQNSVRVHWICLISLEKVNAHLLTSKHGTFEDYVISLEKNKMLRSYIMSILKVG